MADRTDDLSTPNPSDVTIPHTSVSREPARPLPPPQKVVISDNLKWVIVTLAIPLATYLFTDYQKSLAEIKAGEDRKIAEAAGARESLIADARSDVEAMTALLPALSDSDPKKSELALSILERLKGAQHGANSGIMATYNAMVAQIRERLNSPDPKVANLGARQLEAIQTVSESTQQIKATTVAQIAPNKADKVAEIKPTRVYIHTFIETQRAQALAAQEGLRNLGVAVPGIEDVSDKLPRGTLPGWQIRYFSDSDLGAARWAKNHLTDIGYPEFAIFKSRASSTVASGQIELWWPNSRDR
jgi:hypothetical protein